MEGYSLSQIFITFLIYAFLGWCLEVGFHMFKSKKFINRGFLQGPLCPIYGVGAVLILLFLGHLENNVLSIFIGGALFASLLELVTGYTLNKIFKTRWWDYSHKKFNIGGYVSLDFTIIWGFVSIFMMGVLQPRVDRIVMAVPGALVRPIAMILFLTFLLDLNGTVKSLASFKTILRELNGMKIERDKRVEERRIEREAAWEAKKKIAVEELKQSEEEWERSEKEWEEQSQTDEKNRLDRLRTINAKLELRHRVFMKKYPSIIPDEVREKLKELKNR